MFSHILAWIKHILHLDHHGLLPPPPTNGESVTLPAAPPHDAPAPTPAPVEIAPAPVADPYPIDGVASFADANRLIRIKALDELRVSEPRVPHGFRVKDMGENPAKFGLTPEQGKEVAADCNAAMFLGQDALGGNPNAPWRPSHIHTDDGPGGTMREGAEIPDALTFAGDNIIHGEKVYAGVALADIPALIEQWKANGLLPIIDHQPGVVAHA